MTKEEQTAHTEGGADTRALERVLWVPVHPPLSMQQGTCKDFPNTVSAPCNSWEGVSLAPQEAPLATSHTNRVPVLKFSTGTLT